VAACLKRIGRVWGVAGLESRFDRSTRGKGGQQIEHDAIDCVPAAAASTVICEKGVTASNAAVDSEYVQ
jgi:hypothetical protein